MTASGQSWVIRAALAALLVGFGSTLIQSDAAAAEQAVPSWSISPKSLLFVKVFKDRGTIGSGLAHDHVVRASSLQGSLSFDPANSSSCRLSLRIPVRRLVVDEPSLREQVGFEKPIDAEDRKKVRESMLDEDQLDAEHHPTIKIEGRRCREVQGAQDYGIDLAVTIRGRSKKVATHVRVSSTSAAEMRVRGGFTLRHSDFGIEPYSAFLGTVRNAQPIEFVANIVARRPARP
jgi:polyisoprenoid-binding protein YceI